MKIRAFMIYPVIAGLVLFLASCQGQVDQVLAILISPTPTATGSATITLTATLPSQTPSSTLTPLPPTPEPPTGTVTETATPVPTETATETGTITPGPSPTRTRTPTRTRRPTITRTPSRTPTITRTPTQTFTPTPPNAVLRISKPGLFSRISSPIRMEAVVQTGEDGWVLIQLLGEDGRLITEQRLDYRRNPNRRYLVAPVIPFEISAAAETARLVVSSSDQYGRLIYLSSVDLILLKTGRDIINPPALSLEPYLIRYPYLDQTVEGGTLPVIGLARPVNANPLIFELIDEQGQVVGSTQVAVATPEGNLSHTPFQAGISYSVSTETPVRLTIRQESTERIPGTVELFSMLLTLKP